MRVRVRVRTEAQNSSLVPLVGAVFALTRLRKDRSAVAYRRVEWCTPTQNLHHKP